MIYVPYERKKNFKEKILILRITELNLYEDIEIHFFLKKNARFLREFRQSSVRAKELQRNNRSKNSRRKRRDE